MTEQAIAEQRIIEVKADVKESERIFFQSLQDNHFTNTEQYYSSILDKQEQKRLKEKIANYRQKLQLTIEQIKELQKQLTNKEKKDLVALEERVTNLKAISEKTLDRKSTRLNSSHVAISYAVFCLKKKKKVVKS